MIASSLHVTAHSSLYNTSAPETLQNTRFAGDMLEVVNESLNSMVATNKPWVYSATLPHHIVNAYFTRAGQVTMTVSTDPVSVLTVTSTSGKHQFYQH